LAIDHRRRDRSGPMPRLEPAAPDRPDDAAALQVDLARAVHRLSRRQQEVVVMRYLIDLSEEDVAGTLGMSEGSVKTHLSRARGHLREHMIELDRIGSGVDR